MRKDFKGDLSIAFVYVGTVVGAGLASGQEILQFFSIYGRWSFLGILFCALFYIFFSLIIIEISIKNRIQSYGEMMSFVLGKWVGKVPDILTTLFLYGGNVIMISGGAAMLKEYIGFPTTLGIFIMASLTILMSVFSTRGIIAINNLIVPFSILTILFLGFSVLKNGGLSINYEGILYRNNSFLFSSLIYASYNILTATGVLCPMIYESKDKSHFKRGTIIGIIILTLLALIINFVILKTAPKSFYVEIPNLFAVRSYSNLLPPILSLAIFLEMYSTEIANIYSLSKRIEYGLGFSYTFSVLIIVLSSIPFAFIGFSSLIRLLYPAFGLLGILLLTGCIINKIGTVINCLSFRKK